MSEIKPRIDDDGVGWCDGWSMDEPGRCPCDEPLLCHCGETHRDACSIDGEQHYGQVCPIYAKQQAQRIADLANAADVVLGLFGTPTIHAESPVFTCQAEANIRTLEDLRAAIDAAKDGE